MKIGITSDHKGYELKEKLKHYLESNNYIVIDYGTNSNERADYTKYAFVLGKALQNKEVNYGIAICGTGIGMSIALNKVKGVMCAKVSTKKEAYYAKYHNNASAISLSGNITFFKSKKIANAYLNTKFDEDEYHQKRINDILKYEDK